MLNHLLCRIDVFGENARTVVWMDSKEFGKVAVVCVGAMLVGSIIITAEVGSELKRTDEMGYFAFGGSTLIVVFEKGKMNFDHDLLDNSDKTLETLVSHVMFEKCLASSCSLFNLGTRRKSYWYASSIIIKPDTLSCFLFIIISCIFHTYVTIKCTIFFLASVGGSLLFTGITNHPL
jgi:hypothetical protein